MHQHLTESISGFHTGRVYHGSEYIQCGKLKAVYILCVWFRRCVFLSGMAEGEAVCVPLPSVTDLVINLLD